MRQTVLAIELSAPYRVGGQPARHQSLWLLAAACLAARRGGALTAAQLQARFPDAANIRMLVSRAFADFARWGVAVGWGPDRAAGAAGLNPAGRGSAAGVRPIAGAIPAQVPCTPFVNPQ